MMRKTKLVALALSMSLFSVLAMGSADDSSEGTVTNVETNEDGGSEDTGEAEQSTGEAEQSSENTKKEDDVVKVGGSYESGGIKFTFKDVDKNYTPSDDEYHFYKPEKGKKFIACTFKFENTGDSDQYVSIYDFNCYADNESCEQSYISTEDFKNGDFMADDLSAGRTVTFTSFYEVPKDAKSIELEYEPSFWSDEKIIIKVK